MDGFFELRMAADLREKLRRDYAKIESNLLELDAFFNFFVTADSLVDWVCREQAGGAKPNQLRRTSALLRTCSHLANGAKHLTLDDKRHDSVAEATRGPEIDSPFGIGIGITGIMGSLPGDYMVELQNDAARELGPTIEAHELARKVLAYWDDYPLPEA